MQPRRQIGLLDDERRAKDEQVAAHGKTHLPLATFGYELAQHERRLRPWDERLLAARFDELDLSEQPLTANVADAGWSSAISRN